MSPGLPRSFAFGAIAVVGYLALLPTILTDLSTNPAASQAQFSASLRGLGMLFAVAATLLASTPAALPSAWVLAKFSPNPLAGAWSMGMGVLLLNAENMIRLWDLYWSASDRTLAWGHIAETLVAVLVPVSVTRWVVKRTTPSATRRMVDTRSAAREAAMKAELGRRA